MMIANQVKPVTIEDLYPLFKEILIAKHKPDKNAPWGTTTFTGSGFHLKISGEYKGEGKQHLIEITDPDPYFVSKFRMAVSYWQSEYLDRMLVMTLCNDTRGRKWVWSTQIYQHLDQ